MKNIWEKFHLKYLLQLFVIVILLTVVLFENLEYKHSMHGEIVSIFNDYYIGASGYKVDLRDNGRYFSINGDDPQFYLSNLETLGAAAGGVKIDFELDKEKHSELSVQVFYAKAGESYSERKSKKAVISASSESCLIPIPLDHYMTLRFDIDGDFLVKDISICTDKMYSEAYVSEKTIQSCSVYFPVVILGVVLIFWAHIVRKRETGLRKRSYVKYVLLGSGNVSGRQAHYDYMRVLAALLVILAHACSPMVDLADASWKRLVLVCGLSLGLCCNVIYVMLSGSLLLSAGKDGIRDESVISFYIKRASKVIIPLVAYYMLLLSLNGEVSFIPPENIVESLKRVVTGAPDVAPHFWLIYTIVALYIVTPFFKAMVNHLGDEMLISLAVVIFILNLLTTYLPLFGMSFGAMSFLSGWEGVFLLGYILSRQEKDKNTRRYNASFVIAGIIAYIIAVVVVFEDSAQMNYVYNCTPVMVMIAAGIFVFFTGNKKWFKNKLNPVIRLCSKYSYSVILIHWYVLFVLVQGKLHITALRFGCIGGIGATVVTTFLICLLIAVVFDNTVVIVCSVIFEKLVKIITKLKRKFTVK